MAPNPEDLTTLAAVREDLQKQNSDTAQDDVIQSLITAASKQITRTSARQFIAVADATHTFELEVWASGAEKPPVTSFEPWELRDLTSVTIDPGTSSATVLEPEEFRLTPVEKPDGTYLGIRVNPFNAVSPTSSRWGARREITVRGSWGMPSIPEDVAQLVNLTVSIWLRRDVAAFETGMNIDTGYLERPRALPSAVESALSENWSRQSA